MSRSDGTAESDKPGGALDNGSARLVRGSMVANLAHPPLGDRRFWMVQAMVVIAVLVHLAADLAQDAGVFPVPGFVWTLLLLVPTVYAGTVFGLVGSLGAAVGGIALLIPEELLTHHSTTEAWGAWGILSMVLVTAVLLGYRFEEERSLRHRMVEAERERIMGSIEGHSLSWHTLFDALPYGIALVDADGAIRYANGQLEMLSGYQSAQLVGSAVELLVPAGLREHHVAHRNGTRGTSVTRPHGARPGLLLLRQDGAETPVDIALAPLAMDATPCTIVMVRDDSVREQAERARDDAERRFRLAFENNVAGMALASLDGRLVDVNRSYCTMLGLTAADMLGRDVVDVTHPEDRALTAEMNRRLVSGEVEHVSYVKRYLHSDGHVVDANLLSAVVKDESGAPVYLVASVRDVTEERLLAAQLSHQALHDPLTGLANRALFQERFEHATSASDGRDGWSAVMLLDLDDFKSVNDSLGHNVGDQLLVELSRRLSKTARASDMLCRLGGDEFLYLVEGLASAAEAGDVARRLLDALAAPFYLAGGRVEQHASLGVVVRERLGTDWAELLQDADSALYEAKRQGKGGFATFTPEMREQVSVRFALLQELHQALSSDELSMYYQPLVELASGAVVGFEALMRWHQRTRGPISPDVFIPLAERSGLIAELGEFALREACGVAASWQKAVGDGVAPYVSVNLSAHQFHDSALLASIDQMLSEAPLAPDRLVVEITESTALVDVARAARTIEELHRLGVAIALDDFGTGYSSLSYLARLRPDIIKIDKSFVSSRAESAHAESLLGAMVSLGHDLDMIVVAEGIETPEQLARLRALGCDLGQGYLFSRAVPAVDVAALRCLDRLGAC
ncbi:MAG: putative bifunctional diguanylate cyclase/phosphodiesterase [Acidimicrobiales bacterium]